LQKAAGEPVEVLVNGRLIARGEVVVVEDNFAVRITEILSPAERIQRLGV
jgi:flagellar motor switch protein FliN/FliY